MWGVQKGISPITVRKLFQINIIRNLYPPSILTFFQNSFFVAFSLRISQIKSAEKFFFAPFIFQFLVKIKIYIFVTGKLRVLQRALWSYQKIKFDFLKTSGTPLNSDYTFLIFQIFFILLNWSAVPGFKLTNNFAMKTLRV